ncbi:hypothetical protein [Paenibacillus sp. MMS18-CY102]|uniref:hypothetical protein n=1 Tax=Paenibacillus sp. MMS18-CY102 TaxID=2682849 RepID=UPI0013655F5F|nr:hypothetical protein [Paenibacillus sp. MMS18-CY102]MWC27098.1 hypothetical protein [Paenibacillus sp. MMS18-CY102]
MRKLIRNKFVIVLLVALLLFGAWNLVWLIMTKNRYHGFLEAVPKNERGTHVISDDEGYSYNVKTPDYLHFTGNLGVSNFEKGEALIIWPLINGGYEFGFRLQKDGKAFEIYVDEHMNPIDTSDENMVELVKKYKAEIDAMYARAEKVWDL